MLRIALAVVAAVGLTFAADAQIGPLCQRLPMVILFVLSPCLGRGGVAQIGPLCQTLSMAIWLSVTPCTADPRTMTLSSDSRWQSNCLSLRARLSGSRALAARATRQRGRRLTGNRDQGLLRETDRNRSFRSPAG